MGQVRHGSAMTTHAVIAAIQRSQASLSELSRELGINPKTVAKWRKRQTVEDQKTGPSVDSLKLMSPQERLERLEAAVPQWIERWTLRYRYVLLAVLINLPGNSLIGGGGGILLAAGLSGCFRFQRFW